METNLSVMIFKIITIDKETYKIDKSFNFENKFYFSAKNDAEKLEIGFLKEDITSCIKETLKESDYDLSETVLEAINSNDKIIGEYFYNAFRSPTDNSGVSKTLLYIKVVIDNVSCLFCSEIEVK